MGCAPAVLFRLQQTLQCPGTLAGEGHPEGPTTSRVLTPRPLVSGHHHLLSDLGGPRGSAPPPHETSILSPPPLITGPTASTLGGGGFPALAPRRVFMQHDSKAAVQPSSTSRQRHPCSTAKHGSVELDSSQRPLGRGVPGRASVPRHGTAAEAAAPRETERLDLALPRSGACVTNLLGVGAEGHFPEKRAKRRCCFGFQTSVSPILDLK